VAHLRTENEMIVVPLAHECLQIPTWIVGLRLETIAIPTSLLTTTTTDLAEDHHATTTTARPEMIVTMIDRRPEAAGGAQQTTTTGCTTMRLPHHLFRPVVVLASTIHPLATMTVGEEVAIPDMTIVPRLAVAQQIMATMIVLVVETVVAVVKMFLLLQGHLCMTEIVGEVARHQDYAEDMMSVETSATTIAIETTTEIGIEIGTTADRITVENKTNIRVRLKIKIKLRTSSRLSVKVKVKPRTSIRIKLKIRTKIRVRMTTRIRTGTKIHPLRRPPFSHWGLIQPHYSLLQWRQGPCARPS
jgi:hypothetical protein